MSAPVAKQQMVFLSGRDLAGNPTIYGPHMATWLEMVPGVWFLIDLRRAS